ncbi:MAG: CPBP family intramembrane metalloprotease [Candidatus Melainabacteria bacterium]|nr:CPBP family intramembrane metalloprotease [Candidatus Melainabacteria bacterium]
MAEFVSADPNGLEAHQKSPYRHLWWLVLLGIAGCVIYFTKNDEVFAAASLNLSMPKDQIVQKAGEWAVKLGYNPQPSAASSTASSRKPQAGELEAKSPAAQTQRALKSITFSYDDDAKSFLEYELGVRKANELMMSEIPVWYWRVRMVRELEQEELRVFISPDGKLSGLSHDFENDKRIPSLTHMEAEAFARNFVEKETGNSLLGFDLIKDEESQKPKRKDHSFTFEDTKKNYKGAKMRVFVGLAGNRIESYNRYLHVPEAWERKFADIRSYNMMLAKIAQIFMTLLMLVSVFAFGWAVMTRNIRWVPVVAISMIYSFVPFLDSINNFNELVDGYDTSVTYGSYVTTELVKLLVMLVPSTFGAIILFGAAEALYRKAFPDHIAIEKIFTLDGLKSKAVSMALLVGQLLFLIDLGWVVLYYLAGQKVGFWCPLGVENYQILSSYVPALSAMRVGVTASFMEEALYRVVGMSLMMKVSGNFWVANLFQAAAWGFAHSTYPQQPFYARGVELTLGGLLDGWILRRYGILACVASHYVFDTFLGVKPLFTSGDMTLKATAFLSVIPFVALMVFGASRWKVCANNEVETNLLNRSLNVTIHDKELEETEPEEKPISYQPITPQRRLFFFVVTVLLGFSCFVLRVPILNVDAKVRIERPQAEAKATEILTRHGVEAPGYTVVSWLSAQGLGDSAQYLYEKVGLGKTAEIIEKSHSGGYCWRVRFFKPKTPEEYEAQLDGAGREIGFDIRLAEDTKGAILTKEDALKKACQEIDSTYPYLKPYELESASEQKRPARTDWSFVFRAKQFDAGEARFKINTTVLGNLVSGATWLWEVPDKWTFERTKRSFREDIAGHIYRGGYILMFVLAAIWAVGVLRARAVKVRPALLIGVIYTIVLIPAQLNALPLFFSDYLTTTPVNNFLTDQISSYVRTFIGAFFMSAILAAFAIASLRILFPQVRLSNYFLAVMRPHNSENRSAQRTMWVDGALAGYAYVAVLEVISVVAGLLRTRFSPDVPQSSLSTVSSLLNLQFPPFDALLTGPVQGAQEVLIVAIAVGFYARYCQRPRMYFVITTVLSLGTWCGTKYYQDAIIGFVSSVAFYALSWLFIAKIAKTNPVAYFTAGLASVLFSRILSIVFHGLPVMLPTLAVSAVLLAGPAIVAAILSMRSEIPSALVTAISPAECAALEPTAPESKEIATEVREETSTAPGQSATDEQSADRGSETPEDDSCEKQ